MEVDVYAANIDTQPLNHPSSVPLQVAAAERVADPAPDDYDLD